MQVWALLLLVAITEQTAEFAEAMAEEGKPISLLSVPLGSGN